MKSLKMDATFKILLMLFTALSLSCESSKKDDIKVDTPNDTNYTGKTTYVSWESSKYVDPKGALLEISKAGLATGVLPGSLGMTYFQANMPISLYYAGLKENSGSYYAPMPHLIILVEEKTTLSIRHIKSVNGQNVSSSILVGQGCPAEITASLPVETEGEEKLRLTPVCIPLINAVVNQFLVPSDTAGAYLHEIYVSAKADGKDAGTLASKISVNIIIPTSPVTVKPAIDLSSLKISERLLMATNDLKGSPRRDFRAFEITSDIAPGVATSWVLTFTNPVFAVEEDIFFENPINASDNPSKATISRGYSFFKRTTRIDSVDHLRINLINAEKPDELQALASGRTSVIELPISEPTAPLRIFISPDFGSPRVVRSMTDYVKPFAPTFCPEEILAFKPEEWRQARLNESYTACEARVRKRLSSLADALREGVTSPIETFFGAFSYMPRLNSRGPGGTHGVLAMRVSFTATLKVDVRNPHNTATVANIATVPISFNFQLPSVLSDMDDVIKSGKAPPGLDTILTSMLRKGVLDFPIIKDGRPMVFPFMGLTRTDVMY